MGNKICTESKPGGRGMSFVTCTSERLTLITANHQAPDFFFIAHWAYAEISSKSRWKSWLSTSNLSTMLMRILSFKNRGFPDSSVGKEYVCNAGDPSSIPESGRSPGEGIGYPLQYSWVSLMAKLVKNPPAMWENWVWSMGWEDPLEKGKAAHSSILAWRIPWIGIVRGVSKSRTWLSDFHFQVSRTVTCDILEWNV